MKRNILLGITLVFILVSLAQAEIGPSASPITNGIAVRIETATSTLADTIRENATRLTETIAQPHDELQQAVRQTIFSASAACGDSPGAQKVVSIARREVGIKENNIPYPTGICPSGFSGCTNDPGGGECNWGVNSCKRPGSQAVGSVNDYQDAAGIGHGPKSYWCAAFVTWVFREAGFPLNCPGSGCVSQIIKCADDRGWSIKQGVRSAAPGDIVVWDKGGDFTPGGCEADHTGIVTRVDPDGKVWYVDGNGDNNDVSEQAGVDSRPFRLISVPGVGRPTGCTGDPGGLPPADPDEGEDPVYSVRPNAYIPPPQTHTVCRRSTCVLKDGPGLNQCQNGADCKTYHSTCSGGQCIIVPEPGTDECFPKTNKIIGNPDRDCHDRIPTRATTPAVGLKQDCTTVPGSGNDSCKAKHTTCSGNLCILVYEPGDDECILPDLNNPSNPNNNKLVGFPGKCPLATHKECSKDQLSSRCATVPGPGPDTCVSDVKCQNPPEPPDAPECSFICIDKDICLGLPIPGRIVDGDCSSKGGGVCCRSLNQINL